MEESLSVKFQNIILELKSIHDRDQAMRLKAVKNPDLWDDKLDLKNTARLKEIIDKIGWPTISKVDEEGSNQAWLLAQHADHDLEFQKKCLKLMKAEPETEVKKPNIAFLEDRIAVSEKRPQLYGTQFFRGEGGKLIPRPIFEREKIDERRRERGMDSFEEYERLMNETYKA